MGAAIARISAALLTLESNKKKSRLDFLRQSSDPSTVLAYVSPTDHFTEFLLTAKKGGENGAHVLEPRHCPLLFMFFFFQFPIQVVEFEIVEGGGVVVL